MARRGRGGGAWPNYEDFKPNSEWQQDDENHNLIICIPGFMKEQLKVSTEGPNIIRVRGERLVGGSKWSRFHEDFDVPENSNTNQVRAKFHGGTLTITLPKKPLDDPSKEEKTMVEEDKSGTTKDQLGKGDTKASNAEHGALTKAAKGLAVAAKETVKEGKNKVIESSGAEHGAFTKAVQGLTELNDERQLMVNMGVAVLVIMSLSAYVTYKFVAGDDKK